jgi:hypothetical protein
MSGYASTRCYVEEYEVAPGKLGARLREKGSGRKVDLGGTSSEIDLQQFRLFLGALRANKADMPGVFEKDDAEDTVVVEGDLDFDAPDEIRFIYNEKLTFGVV